MYENCPTNLNNKITIKYKCLGSKPQVFNHNSGFMKAEVDVDCRSRIPVIQNQTQRDHGAVRKSDNKFIKLSVTNIRCVGLIEEDQGRVFLRRWNLIWSWSFQWSAAISIQCDIHVFFWISHLIHLELSKETETMDRQILCIGLSTGQQQQMYHKTNHG